MSKNLDSEKTKFKQQILDHFSHPHWKNPYIRLMIFTLMILNADTLSALFSNYTLYEFLRSKEFHLNEIYNLSMKYKLTYAILSPIPWLALNYLSVVAITKYHKKISKYYKETSNYYQVASLRKERSELQDQNRNSNFRIKDLVRQRNELRYLIVHLDFILSNPNEATSLIDTEKQLISQIRYFVGNREEFGGDDEEIEEYDEVARDELKREIYDEAAQQLYRKIDP